MRHRTCFCLRFRPRFYFLWLFPTWLASRGYCAYPYLLISALATTIFSNIYKKKPKNPSASPLNTSTEAKAVAVNFWMHTLAMISTSSAAINIRHHPQMSRNPIVRQVSTTTTASNADDEAQYHSELEDTGLILSSSW